MKPIFRTDLALAILGLSSLVTGILIHHSWHFAQHIEWHNWSVVHCVVNIALLIAVGFHIKQHKGWFKNIFKRSSLKAKMPIFVTLCSLATIGSGIYLLIFAKGEGTHAGLVHYWLGMIFGIFAILHFAKRWKVFRKGITKH